MVVAGALVDMLVHSVGPALFGKRRVFFYTRIIAMELWAPSQTPAQGPCHSMA